MKLNLVDEVSQNSNLVVLGKKTTDFAKHINIGEVESVFLNLELQKEKDLIIINHHLKKIFIIIINEAENIYKQKEKLRKIATTILKDLNSIPASELNLIECEEFGKLSLAFIEGFLLSDYSFTKYLTKKRDDNKIQTFNIKSDKILAADLETLKNISEAVYITRTLVNEPFSYLDTQKFVEEIKQTSKIADFKCEIFDKKKIETLKMGGLLNVNKGSIQSPAFAILEWAPENAKNTKPIVLVGKGIVYDTGGLSLKPTHNSMDSMKTDMAGAATVLGLFYAFAKNKVEYHVIGLLPISDNACSNYAYVPGDVITMYNGMTVEVMNTDAEGRLILADALSYASKYEPEIVIDLATLTGAAVRAVGTLGIVAMGTVNDLLMNNLKKSGNETYERIVELPLWEEYQDAIKSPIADLKNIGGADAGAITAGKFLENFVKYPWIHLDIAPTAFIPGNKDYRGNGATASGIRLLYDFIINY